MGKYFKINEHLALRRATTLLIGAVLLLLVLASCAKPAPTTPLNTSELLDLGERYLLDLNYEQAVAQFLAVIEIEPMNARAYIGAAEAYLALGRTDDAIAVLERGLNAMGDNSAISAMLEQLRGRDSSSEDWSYEDSSAVEKDGIGNLRQFGYSDFTYEFTWGDDTMNAGSLGTCWISLKLPESEYGALIWTWKEGGFSEYDIIEAIDISIPVWRDANVGAGIGKSTGEFRQGHPVREGELGKAINVLLIVLDENTEAVGYIVLPTQTPMTEQ